MVARREGQQVLLCSSGGARAWAAPLSCAHHGPLSCPCVPGHGAGLCRHASAQGLGAVGPDAASALYPQLPGTEGAVGGHAAGVSCCCCCCWRGMDAPTAAAQGSAAPQLGRAAPAAAGSCRAQLPDKGAQAAWGSRSSLPVYFATAQDPGSPSEPCAIHQTPGEGVELLPCSECLSALGSVPEHYSPS